MATAADVLARKGKEVVTIAPDATVLDAAARMNDRHIGSLVVTDGRGAVVGMVTERDVLTRVVAARRDPSETTVRDVMSAPVLFCRPDSPLDEIRRVMRERRVRHLPVLADETLAGMISIGDLNHAEAQVLVETIRTLEQFVYRP